MGTGSALKVENLKDRARASFEPSSHLEVSYALCTKLPGKVRFTQALRKCASRGPLFALLGPSWGHRGPLMGYLRCGWILKKRFRLILKGFEWIVERLREQWPSRRVRALPERCRSGALPSRRVRAVPERSGAGAVPERSGAGAERCDDEMKEKEN